MRSSATKSRDMARSILPSRARSTTAHLALTRRANRHAITQRLSYIRSGGRADQEDWDESSDLRAYPDAEIAMIVRWRRGADKLNHFERWAVQVTKPLPVEDRLGHLQAMLPTGLIGDHAMSHRRRLPELDPAYMPVYAFRFARLLEQNATRQAEERMRMRSLVMMILETGGHGLLNSALKATALDGERLRTLGGTHDVDAFLSTLRRRLEGGAVTVGRSRSSKRPLGIVLPVPPAPPVSRVVVLLGAVGPPGRSSASGSVATGGGAVRSLRPAHRVA
jgi:hypothetical protein